MAFNGSGSWSYTYSWVNDAANGIPITASRMDAQFNDIGNNGFDNTITRDGQGVPTANLPMASFQHTGAASATAAGQYVVWGQAATLAATSFTGTVTSTGFTDNGSGNGYTSAGGPISVNYAAQISITGGQFNVVNGGSGGVALVNGATAWTPISDEGKKNITAPLVGALEKLATLRTVTGTYKADPDAQQRLFLIAQDVQKVYPEAVAVGDDGTLHLDYTAIVVPLVAAIQDLSVLLKTRAV